MYNTFIYNISSKVSSCIGIFQGFNICGHCLYLLLFAGSLVFICVLMYYLVSINNMRDLYIYYLFCRLFSIYWGRDSKVSIFFQRFWRFCIFLEETTKSLYRVNLKTMMQEFYKRWNRLFFFVKCWNISKD